MIYAVLDENGICCTFHESSTEINDSSYILVSEKDEDMIFRKKWDVESQTWVDTDPTEVPVENSRRLTHTDSDGVMHWMNDFINEVFQSASDGKTAIANAITGVDSSITIPENPTFAQLASLIGQMGLHIEMGTMSETTIPATIEGTTSFRPKIVIVYNFGSGLSNFNMGVYVSPTVTEVTTQQISDSANGIGGTLSRRANAFTVTDNGFSMINTGAVTNLKWIAIG